MYCFDICNLHALYSYLYKIEDIYALDSVFGELDQQPTFFFFIFFLSNQGKLILFLCFESVVFNK